MRHPRASILDTSQDIAFQEVSEPAECYKGGIIPRSLPLLAVAFYMALFIIRPWEQLFPWMAEIRIEKFYALMTIGIFVLSHKKVLRADVQLVTVLLFFCALLTSAIFAWDSSLSWSLIYKYMTLIIIYLLLTMVIRTPYELTFIICCYLAIMFLYMAKSQWEFFIHGAGEYRMGVLRLTGIDETSNDPNSFAASIVYSLPMLVYLWSGRKRFTANWPKAWKKWFPVFLICCAYLALSSIVLTNSRSGMLTFVLFVLLLVLRGKGTTKKLVFVMLAVFFLSSVWLLMSDENRNRLRTVLEP